MKGPNFDFHEKTIIITGGSSGIGRETALLMGGFGANIVVADIQKDKGEQTVREIAGYGCEAKFVYANVSSVPDIEKMFAETIEAFGEVDVLVNCAGISDQTPLMEISLEEWDRVMRVNLASTFFCSQKALQHMCPRKQGVIVNIGSSAGKSGGIAVGAHYSASKAGVICLTKTLALYGAQYGVRVNCVCPGTTNTPMTKHWTGAVRAALVEKIPLKRLGEPQEVADAICFLASPVAKFITGETLNVNGGMIMD